MKTLKKIVLLIGLCLLQVVSHAAEMSVKWNDDNVSSILNKAKELMKGGELPPIETSLFRNIEINIEAGIVNKRVREIVFLPSFTEAHNNGTQYLNWDKATQGLVIKEAAVVLPDLSHRRMDPDNIRVRDNDVYNTFTNSKEVVIPLSGLANKSITVLEYEKRTKLSDLESIYGDLFYPVGFSQGVEQFQLSVTSDANFEFDWSNDHPDVDCQLQDHKLSCKAEKLKKYPYDNNMLWRDELPHIAIAKKSSWNAVVKHLKSAFNDSNHLSHEVREQAKKLVKGADTTMARIHKLHEFASRGIRYVSMSELGHRITPHSFSDVIENLFGDCKDKSALLVDLLKAIGVDAYPVLVATERRKPAKLKVPSSLYFDHMVVCFELIDKNYCLDPTDNNTHWQSTSSWVQGKVSLPLLEDAKPEVIPVDDYKWMLRYTTRSEFDELAAVKESVTKDYWGVYASAMRQGFNSLDEEAENEWLLKNYHENVSTLVTPVFTLKNVDKLTNYLSVSSTAEYEPYVSPNTSLNSTDYDSWLRSELKNAKVTTKYYGNWVDGVYVKSTAIYDLSKLWKVKRLPATLSFIDEFLTLRRETTFNKEGELQITTELWIKSHYVEQNEVEDFNRRIDILMNASQIHIEGDLISSKKG
ncbi:hypothetical protein NBRC116583_08570 [Arenicella sp. 4NH20-0111]|uniref:transglutaminase-like domain-containing protein n=1 Tax=Arenicella sp. 4NH20-0111 TaxID=3127648 RepID=UPI003104FA7A